MICKIYKENQQVSIVIELTLQNLPLGSSGRISRCLSPLRDDIYRLLEMGLCRGAQVTVLRKEVNASAIELGLKSSRLCIAKELAGEFMAEIPAHKG